jgi:hypothetical protein
LFGLKQLNPTGVIRFNEQYCFFQLGNAGMGKSLGKLAAV